MKIAHPHQVGHQAQERVVEIDIEGHAAGEEQHMLARAAALDVEDIAIGLQHPALAGRGGEGLGRAGQDMAAAARQQHGIAIREL